jgi:hypothetical protein
MSAELLLSRLNKVRGRGPGQWSAQCPAHDDKGPSLSIKELPDGRVLLHCFAGCSVEDVVATAGVAVADLFPPRENHGGPVKRRRLLSPSQALDLLNDEAQLVALIASDIARGEHVSGVDRDRVLQAAGRIAYLTAEVRA